MSKFMKRFIIYLVFWAVVFSASAIFIKDDNWLMSVLLLELIIMLIGLGYLQMVFIGVRQGYTTDKMNKSIKGVKMDPISHSDLDSNYKKHDFTLTIIDEVRIYHKYFETKKFPSLKNPFMISHVWLDKHIPIEKVVDYHQEYALNQYQDMKVKNAILVTFVRDSKDSNGFMKTVIYDNSKRLSFYHVPVLITDNKTYLYDPNDYIVNKQLEMIIEHTNKAVQEKKLEF